MNCPFCELHALQGQILHRGSLFYVMTNIKPLVDGHIMIIPFRHIREETKFNRPEWLEFRKIMRWANLYIKRKYDKDVFSFVNAPSGQSVLHYHRHLLPNPFVAHGADTALREYLVHKNGACNVPV